MWRLQVEIGFLRMQFSLAPCITNFYGAKSRSNVFSLQHENLLREEVVVGAHNKRSQPTTPRFLRHKLHENAVRIT